MRLSSLARLALQRLRSRLGLTLFSLLGVVLTVGWVASLPMFSQGVSYQMLYEELARLSTSTHRPPVALHLNYLASVDKPLPVERARALSQTVRELVAQRMGMTVRQSILRIGSPSMDLGATNGEPVPAPTGNVARHPLTLDALQGIEQHIQAVEGKPFGQASREDRWAVWAYELQAAEMGLRVGDEIDLYEPTNNLVFPVYIAGVWQAKDPGEEYWFSGIAGDFRYSFVLPMDVYESEIEPLLKQHTYYTTWYLILEEGGMGPAGADRAAAGLKQITNQVAVLLPGVRVDHSPMEPLTRYLQRKAVLSALLIGFSVPVMGLLFYFISLVSTVTVQFQREEAAILASRGSGPGLAIGLAVAEGLYLVAGGLLPGLALGYALARLMGFSQSFLHFVDRAAPPASLAGLDWRLLAVAIVILVGARVLPALRGASRSIVSHVRERSRALPVDVMGRVAVDVPLVVVSAYAYRQLRLRGTLGILGWEPSGDPFRDPLLLLAPSLFIFTAALVASHLFPLLVRPLDLLADRLHSFPFHAGLRQLVRQSGQYASPLFLVIVCLSLGAFYSSLAASLDRWLGERIAYEVGADYTFEINTFQGGPGGGNDVPTSGPLAEGGWLLPIEDYASLPGVQRATRVGEYPAVTGLPGTGRIRLLGVDRVDFPKVVYFRRDYAPQRLVELMNRLAQHNDGLIVSRQLMAAQGLSEGLSITIQVEMSGMMVDIPFTIVGTYDYFPTVDTREHEAFIANLDYIFDQVGGPAPFGVWLRTSQTADTTAYPDVLRRMGVEPMAIHDRRELAAQDLAQVERVGLFGSLSIGFLAASILSAVGLLIYSYASLQSRLQALSVLRAIGAQMRQTLAMEAIEYGGVILFGVAAGVAVGGVASRLFVRFFQFSSKGGVPVPPFLPQIAWTQIAWLAAIFAAALAISQFVLLRQAMRRDVFQVLRMGQRE